MKNEWLPEWWRRDSCAAAALWGKALARAEKHRARARAAAEDDHNKMYTNVCLAPVLFMCLAMIVCRFLCSTHTSARQAKGGSAGGWAAAAAAAERCILCWQTIILCLNWAPQTRGCQHAERWELSGSGHLQSKRRCSAWGFRIGGDAHESHNWINLCADKQRESLAKQNFGLE